MTAMKTSLFLLIVLYSCALCGTSDAHTRIQKIPDPGSACSKSVLGQHPTPEAIIRCLFAPEVIQIRLNIGKGGFEFYYFTTLSFRRELDREIACMYKWNGLCTLDINPTIWNDDFDQVYILSIDFDGIGSAVVDFSNFGKPNRSIYRFKRENGEWRIDNIESQRLNENEKWVTLYNLRDMLAEGRKSEAEWVKKKLQR